jgi:hypothetical protein
VFAAALAVCIGWCLVTQTCPVVYDAIVNKGGEPPPPFPWWIGRFCAIVLETALIILLITFVVRNPHKR